MCLVITTFNTMDLTKSLSPITISIGWNVLIFALGNWKSSRPAPLCHALLESRLAPAASTTLRIPAEKSFLMTLEHEFLIYSLRSGPVGELSTNPDGIVKDAQGRVIFTDFDGHIYRITPRDKHIESVASIPGAELNGVALLHGGDLVVASSDSPPALLRVNPDTGEISTLYQGTPFRNPEDVAVDSDGKNVYVLDSDYKGSFSDSKPAIYVFNLSTGTLSAVYVGPPLCACGIVDMLLRPFTGHP